MKQSIDDAECIVEEAKEKNIRDAFQEIDQRTKDKALEQEGMA